MSAGHNNRFSAEILTLASCYNFHMTTPFIPPRLEEIIEDFAVCEGNEKLEYLLEFAETLPPLPPGLTDERDQMEEVHECLTPVFVTGKPETEGKMVYYFDAPRDSPTVRGFATILMEGVNDSATPAQVLAIPDDFYLKTGLQKVLTGQRMNGMGTFLRYMKRIAQDYVD